MKSFLILGLVAVAGAVSWLYLSPDDEQVFCTQEALLCPDGSYVGRSGNQCSFDACQGAKVEGILERQSGGFRLLMSSPETGQQEVSYSLPIEIQATNALSTLINKKVVAYGRFTEGNTFSADKLEAAPQSNPSVGKVRVGQTEFINGVRLTLRSVSNDSRCPEDPDIQCIRAGGVTAQVELKSDTDAEVRDIASDAPSGIAFDSFIISITDVRPAPVAAGTIDQQSYILTFRVVPSTTR